MQLIQTVTVPSGGAASIEFTGIPQDGTDLLLIVSARASSVGGLQLVNLQLNNLTSGYSTRELIGTGSSVSTNSRTSIAVAGITDAGTTANTFANTAIYLPNYTSSVAKSTSSDSVSEANATFAWQAIYAGSSTGTAAITSLKLITFDSVNFVQDSTASLYKVTKA